MVDPSIWPQIMQALIDLIKAKIEGLNYNYAYFDLFFLVLRAGVDCWYSYKGAAKYSTHQQKSTSAILVDSGLRSENIEF